MACVLIELGLLLAFSLSCNSIQCEKTTPLRILSLAPFPDDRPSFDPRYSGSGGPGIVPAVQLAIQHINNRSDLLCGYKLEYISADSGCAISSKAMESILEHVFMSRKPVIGIVGPVCSTSATAVAALLARPQVSLLHFTMAISPRLADMKYVNTIKALGTSRVFMKGFIQLMEKYDWKRIGTLFENEREEFRSTHDIFQTEVIASNRSVLSLPVTKTHITIEQFKATQTRVIFLLTAADLAAKIMCLTHTKYLDLTHPNYQWIILANHLRQLKATTFKLDGTQYSCSEKEVQETLNGAIVTAINITRSKYEQSKVLESGSTLEEYSAQYSASLQLSSVNVSKDPNANVYYDGVWTFALALNQSIKPLEDQGYNLSQYTLGHPAITDTIRKEMLELDFNGASARIHFDNVTNEGKPQLDFFRVEEQNVNKIGFYNTLEENLTIYEGIKLIDDEFPREVIRIHPAVGIVVLLLAATVLTVTVLLHVLTVTYRETRSVKATSPNLNHLIFSGCYLFTTITVVLTLQGSFMRHSSSAVTHGVLCSVVGWCIPMGYSLVFGTVFVKSFRIYKFFTGFKHHTGFLLTDNSLTVFVVLFLLADVIVNISWNAVAPWTIVQTEIIADRKVLIQVHCECDYLVVWLAVLMVIKIVLTIAVLYYSILTRRIKRKEFKHSKNINILAYSLVLLYAMGLPTIALFYSNLYAYTLTFCVVSLGTVILCQVTLLFRPFYLLFVSQETRRLVFKRHTTQTQIEDSLIISSE